VVHVTMQPSREAVSAWTNC